MKIKSISPENRPRERLERQGPEALSDAELLALIIKSGSKRENVVDLCNKLISKYGLNGLSSVTLHELTKEHGIGKAKASQIVALFELYKRTKRIVIEKNPIKKVGDIAQIYIPRLKHLQKEHFIAVYLDTRHKIICDQTITVGILNQSLIHPREVFFGAIKNLASAVIVIHNHPSGDPSPSPEDLFVTKRLKETGDIMGIELLDHVIIAGENYWSYRESSG